MSFQQIIIVGNVGRDENERWRDIPGYEGVYQASNLGRIRRIGVVRGAPPKEFIKQYKHKTGYMIVKLSMKSKGKNKKVHRLVMLAFTDRHDPSLIVNHIDGNKCNNRLDNLEWCTHKENISHAMLTLKVCYGNHTHGESSPSSILKTESVKKIRELHAAGGHTRLSLSRLFNVSKSTIGQIVNRKTWKEV